MKLEFRFKSGHFAKEHDLIEKIKNLLGAMTIEHPKNLKSTIKSMPNTIAPRRISQRTHSLYPKYTIFQYSLPLPLSHNNPIISAPQLTTNLPPPLPIVKQPRVRKVYKPKISTFIKAKNPTSNIQHKLDPSRHQKILSLTQSLIDEEQFKGWS